MSRIEFMSKLQELLTDISPAEREETLQYYNDYFDDAGFENESSVIEELESPEKVARTIKSDLENNQSFGQQNNNGFNQSYRQPDNGQFNQQTAPRRSTGTTVLIVLLLIFMFPIWFPLLIAVVGTLFGFGMAVFGLIVGFGAAAFGMAIAGVILFVLSIAKMFVLPLGGIFLMGISLILISISALFVLLTYGLIKIVPYCFRAIVWVCRLPFRQRGGCMA